MFNNIDLGKFFSSGYIFDKTPPPQSMYLYLGIPFGLLVILAIGAWFYYKKLKNKNPLWGEIQTRVFNILFYTGTFGLILLFARFEEIPYLGSRFFLILLFLIFIIWVIFFFHFWVFLFSKKLEKLAQKEKLEKYLPRRPLRRIEARVRAGVPKKG